MAIIIDLLRWKEMQEALEIFRALLGRRTKEAEWQRFFTDYPYVLSDLFLYGWSHKIIPIGRLGKIESDFIFYQKYRECLSESFPRHSRSSPATFIDDLYSLFPPS